MLNMVLDTDEFISAVLISEGPSAKIIEAWEKGEFWLIISNSIIEELRKVFFYNRIRKRCPQSDDQTNKFKDDALISKSYNLILMNGGLVKYK